jgi:hypothetical protein
VIAALLSEWSDVPFANVLLELPRDVQIRTVERLRSVFGDQLGKEFPRTAGFRE